MEQAQYNAFKQALEQLSNVCRNNEMLMGALHTLDQVVENANNTIARFAANNVPHQNPAETAKANVLAKVHSLDFNLLERNSWSDALAKALTDSIDAFPRCGPCNWCEGSHETTCCWVGAQAYRNCESRKVMHNGQTVNAWTHFKRLLAYQSELQRGQQRAQHAAQLSKLKHRF